MTKPVMLPEMTPADRKRLRQAQRLIDDALVAIDTFTAWARLTDAEKILQDITTDLVWRSQ